MKKVSWSATRKSLASISLIALVAGGLSAVAATSAQATGDGVHYVVRSTNAGAVTQSSQSWFMYYHAGVAYKSESVTSGTTSVRTYHAEKPDGSDCSGCYVQLIIGKAWSASTSHDQFPNWQDYAYLGYDTDATTQSHATSGNSSASWDQGYAGLQADSNGNVTFQLKNLDSGNAKTQTMAWVTDDGATQLAIPGYDGENPTGSSIVDIVDIAWNAPVVSTAQSFDFESESGTTNYSSNYDSWTGTGSVAVDAAPAGGSGSAIKFVKGSEDYSGFDAIHTQGVFQITTDTYKYVSFDVYNAQNSARNVLVKLEGSGANPVADAQQAFVTAQPGWSRVHANFTATGAVSLSDAKFTQLDFFPGFGYGSANSGNQGDVFYFDNIKFNQAADAANGKSVSAAKPTATAKPVVVSWTGTPDTLRKGYTVVISANATPKATTTAAPNAVSVTATPAAVLTGTLTATVTAVKASTPTVAPAIKPLVAGVNQVTVTYGTLAATANGGDATLQYQYSTDGGSTWKQALPAPTPSATTGSFVITQNGVAATVSVKMRASNGAGVGTASATATSGKTAGLPGVPAVTATSSPSAGAVVFTVASPAAAAANAPTTGLQYNVGSGWSSYTGAVTVSCVATETVAIMVRSTSAVGNSLRKAIIGTCK